MSAAKKDDAKTLVLIGRKGDGKSATGNTILGQSHFAPNLTGSVRLPPCQLRSTGSIPGFAKVNVIDTPGLFNTEVPQNEVETELRKIFELAQNGIDAFLLVLRIGRFTAELHNTVKYFKDVFGQKVMKHTIVVFTGLDDLKFDGVTFEEYVAELPKDVMKLLPDRRVGFNNRSASAEEKQKQTVFLLTEVTKMENQSRYTIEDFSTNRKQRGVINPSNEQVIKREKRDEDFEVPQPISSEEHIKKQTIDTALDIKPETNVNPGKSDSQASTIRSRSGRYTRNRKEDVIQQLRIAVVGKDSDIFVKKLVKTYPKFDSDEKTAGTNELCTRHRGKVGDQLVLFVDVGDLETVDSYTSPHPVIHSLFTGVSVGLHGVLLTLRVGVDEGTMIRAVNNFTSVFGSEVLKYTVLAFSNSCKLSRYDKSASEFSKNLPEKVSRLLKSPIDKGAIWAFDENDSNEAFSIKTEELTALIGDQSRKRNKKERSFTYEMASRGTGLANPDESRNRRARCIIL